MNSNGSFGLTRLLEWALNNASHECTHQFNNNLDRASLLETLPADHPLYEDALYLKDMWDSKLWIKNPRSAL